ncbi:MAG: ligand-binding sensor domain-containing protein [Methanomicrobiales archaeon]
MAGFLKSGLFFFIIVCAISTVSATIQVIPPASDAISSDRIKDIAWSPDGQVVFATDNGLSVYDGATGKWRILHPDYGAADDTGLMDDFVRAVAYDAQDRLWVGFGSGLQIVNEGIEGDNWSVIRDQHLLKSLIINDLQPRGGEMWVATGGSGLHRRVNGTWTWFGPRSETGPHAHQITGMAVDPRSGTLVVISEKEGVWYLDEGTDRFDPVIVRETPLAGATGIVADPGGGVLLHTAQDVYHRAPNGTVSHLLAARDLDRHVTCIEDLAVTGTGLVLMATDRGLFGWRDGAITLHLTRSDGIGSLVVRFLAVDGSGRLWYTVPGAAGMIPEIGSFEDPPLTRVPGDEAIDEQPTQFIPPTPRQMPHPPDKSDTPWSEAVMDTLHRIVSLLMTPAGEIVPLPFLGGAG